MKTLTIRIDFLKAAMLTAAQRDIRYYLNGVLIDIMPGAYRIVSTDGHRLSCFHVDCPDMADWNQAQIIVPLSALKGMKAHGGIQAIGLTYDETNPLAECRITGMRDGDRVFQPIDGRYPDYSRILTNSAPTGTMPEGLSINAAYLADLQAQAEILGCKYGNAVYPNGDSHAVTLIHGCPEFYGAIMPMRAASAPWTLPAWLMPKEDRKAA